MPITGVAVFVLVAGSALIARDFSGLMQSLIFIGGAFFVSGCIFVKNMAIASMQPTSRFSGTHKGIVSFLIAGVALVASIYKGFELDGILMSVFLGFLSAGMLFIKNIPDRLFRKNKR